MYLTHVVRTMRDDPTLGVEVTLLVRLPDGIDPDVVSDPAREAGASYEGETTFGDAAVRVDQSDVGPCSMRFRTRWRR